MTAEFVRRMPRLAAANLVAAVAQAAAGVVLVIVSFDATISLPVVVSLPTLSGAPFATVQLAAAFAAVAFFIAAMRLLVALPPVRSRYEAGLRAHRHGLRWIEYSQTAGITVFLVAQLNGIAEAGALILVYAIAAGAVTVLWLQDRSPQPGARGLLPFSVGAAIGIVPWGVVALYQVVALLAAQGGAALQPGALVRVSTVAFLVLAAGHWVSAWFDHQRRGPWAAPWVAEVAHIGLGLASSAVMVVVAVLGSPVQTVPVSLGT